MTEVDEAQTLIVQCTLTRSNDSNLAHDLSIIIRNDNVFIYYDSVLRKLNIAVQGMFKIIIDVDLTADVGNEPRVQGYCPIFQRKDNGYKVDSIELFF